MSSCYNCARSFSLLNREKACDRCGFAFCGKCLTNINADKDRDNYKGKKEIKVCGACKKIESGSPCSPAASVPRPRSPPTALERRIEQLNVLPPQPITVYSRESQKEKRMAKLKRGMTEEDTAIAERLERLQRDRKVLQRMPSDSEMEQRLATLKGVPQSEEAKVNGGGDPSIAAGFYHAPESRVPDATRAEDLISRMTEEVKLDDKAAEDGIGRAPADPAKDVAERLAKLRGLSVDEDEARRQRDRDDLLRKAEEQEDLPSDEEADRLVEKLMAESRLPDVPMDDDSVDVAKSVKPMLRQIARASRDNDEDEELPWCSICNEDASLRCRDCDGDLFCRRCFNECHGEFEMDHKADKYTPPKKQ